MRGMARDLLVDPVSLGKELGSSELRIIDATWYLPSEGRDARAEYGAAHLPGAVYLDLSTDLAEGNAPVRNSVAPPENLAKTFGRAGIGRGHRVVVYDRRGGYSAGRVWWTLRYAGHENVALLDGGLDSWREAAGPISVETPEPSGVPFELATSPEWLMTKSDLLEIVATRERQIVDVRSAERFAGRGAEPARHRGHIPGSINIPYPENLDSMTQRFRPLDELREVYEAAGVRFDRPVVTTCGSGVTASLAAFTLTLLGHEQVAVYDGSWAEWGNSDDVPIEAG